MHRNETHSVFFIAHLAFEISVEMFKTQKNCRTKIFFFGLKSDPMMDFIVTKKNYVLVFGPEALNSLQFQASNPTISSEIEVFKQNQRMRDRKKK